MVCGMVVYFAGNGKHRRGGGVDLLALSCHFTPALAPVALCNVNEHGLLAC